MASCSRGYQALSRAADRPILESMGYQAKGRLHAIMYTEQKTERFRKRDFVVDALIRRMTPGELTSQPDRAVLAGVLDGLLVGLPNDCGTTEAPPCDVTYTRSAVKGACAALLSSAAITLH